MIEYPKISIITPSFNQGEFIEETILSVIGQGYPNLEYIIIDGGSNDNTVDVIKKYERHLTYCISEKDKGQSHAINKGFFKATGDIIGWLNSDDMYLPNCLKTVSTLLDKNDTSILYGNCIHFMDKNDELISWGSNVVNLSKKTTLENVDFISQASSFWTMKTWQKVSLLNEDLHYAFDWDWFLNAKKLGVQFINTSKCLSLYRIHQAHKSGNGGKKRQQEILAVYDKHSQKYARLYQLVMSENFDESFFKISLIKKILRKNTGYTKGDILKQEHPGDYKDYSKDEIDFCISML